MTLLVSAPLVLAAALAAHAQCAFDAPPKAKGIKSSLVRAYASCPGATFASPNTTTMAGVPGCAPPTASSPYSFDDKGSCSVSVTHKVETPCSDGITPSCSIVTPSIKCKGILDLDGITLTSSPGWTLGVVTRATFDDSANGDMTIVDVPTQFTIDDVVNGKLKGKFPGPCVGICPIFGPSEALPACVQVEIISVLLNDPDGNAFARLGSSGR